MTSFYDFGIEVSRLHEPNPDSHMFRCIYGSKVTDDLALTVVSEYNETPMWIVLLAVLDNEEDKSLKAGNFSNFDETLGGHEIVLPPWSEKALDFMHYVRMINQQATAFSSKWNFRYDYKHMGEVNIVFMVDSEELAVFLKVML